MAGAYQSSRPLRTLLGGGLRVGGWGLRHDLASDDSVLSAQKPIVKPLHVENIKRAGTKRENPVEAPGLVFMGQDSLDKSRASEGRFRASHSLCQKNWGLAYFRALHGQESSI